MYKEYTADEEMPDCGKCDHLGDDFNCGRLCGAEHGWWGYRRTEKVNQDTIPVIQIKKKEVQ